MSLTVNAPENIVVAPKGARFWIAPQGASKPNASNIDKSMTTIDPDWFKLGFTRGASVITFEQERAEVLVDEIDGPIDSRVKRRRASLTGEYTEQLYLPGLAALLNLPTGDGDGAIVDTSAGSGQAAVTKLSLAPEAGPVQVCLEWERADGHRVRFYIPKAVQADNLQITVDQDADQTTTPFRFEVLWPTDGSKPWETYVQSADATS